MSENILQRKQVSKKRSFGLTLFMITLNLFLLDLILDLYFLKVLIYIAGGLALFFGIIGYFKYKRNTKSYYKTGMSFPDVMRLATKYLRMNRIYLIATLLGLILSTIVISQIVLLSANYEQNAFDDFIETADTTGYVFNGYRFNDEAINDWESHLPSFEKLLSDKGIELKNSSTSITHSINARLGLPNIDPFGSDQWINVAELRLLEYTEEAHTFYSQFSQFIWSYDSNETILLLPNWSDPSDILNSENEVSFLVGPTQILKTESFNYINSTAVRSFSVSFEEEQNYRDSSSNYDWRIFQPTFLTTKDHIEELVEIFQDSEVGQGEFYYSGLSQSIQTLVFLDLPTLSDVDIDDLINQFESASNEIWQWLEEFRFKSDFWVEWSSPLLDSMRDYRNSIEGLNAILLLITTPMIALALFLVYFSLTLVEQRKHRLMATMKMRGSSREQLQVLLAEEALATGILAIFVGMILSIPWTSLALQDAGILSESIDLSSLIIPVSWYTKLPIIGLILTIDLNLPNILRLISTTVEEGDDFEESKMPFWQRYNLDLILFILSLAFWIGFRFISLGDQTVFAFIMVALSPLMFIIFLIGAPLVMARYFSEVIAKFSNVVWNTSGGILALATRNMRKNRFSSSKLAALLLMGVMISSLSLIIPDSLENWNHNRVNYDLGSDIKIEGLDMSNTTAWGLMDIQGVEAYSQVIEMSFFSAGTSIGQTEIIGVNATEFAQVAFWEDEYADNSLETILSKITRNDTILVQESLLPYVGSDLGEDFFISYSGPSLSDNVVFQLEMVDTFTYFPSLVKYLPPQNQGGDFFYLQSAQLVMSLEMAYSIAGSFGGMTSSAYIKLDKGANSTAIAENLREIYDYNATLNVISAVDELAVINQEPTTEVIFSALKSMLVITIIVSIIAVTYFSFITLAERKKEFGVFRSMGMVRNQIFLLLFIEGITLLSVSIILGFGAGFFASSNIFFFLEQIFGAGGSNPAPPVHLFVPWLELAIFAGVMFVLTTMAAMVPAQITANKQTGSILRAE